MEVKDVLTKAREILRSPECWTQGSWAEIRENQSLLVSTLDKKANCFCLGGALARAAGYDIQDSMMVEYPPVLQQAFVELAAVVREMGVMPDDLPTVEVVTHFNDTHGYYDVIRLLDDTIARL